VFRVFALLSAFALGSAPAYAVNDGPYAATVMLGFPHVLNVSGEYLNNSATTFAIALGAITIKPQSAQFSLGNIEARARWHPWDGAFMLGGILGVQSIEGAAREVFADPASGVQVPVDFSMKVSSLYVTPHLGWLWLLKTGFVIGLELGLQIPIGVKSSFDTSPGDPAHAAAFELVKSTEPYQDLRAKIEDAGDKLGKVAFPYVTALRVGWRF
jgi:hypothetical protein